MLRSILLVTVLILAPGVFAVEPETGEKHIAIWPIEKWSPDNPYAKQLPEARKAAADALAKLQTLIQTDPFNFDAQVTAYYAYVRAQARVEALLDLARQWERKHKQGRFTGHVYSIAGLDFEPVPLPDAPMVKEGEADAAERMIAPDVLKRATPVAGAKITLRTQLYWIMNAKDGSAPTTATEPGVKHMIYPPPPHRPEQIFTATSLKDGSYAFEKEIPAETYSMTVERKGFQTWYGTVTVPATGKVERNVYLTQFRALVGTVSTIPLVQMKELRAGAGAGDVATSSRADLMPPVIKRRLVPVEGAEVSLRPEPMVWRGAPGSSAEAKTVAPGGTGAIPPLYHATTNARGAFRIKELPAGRYILRVSKKGLQDFEAPLSIKQTLQRQDLVLLPQFEVPVPVPMRKPAAREENAIDAPTGTSLDRPFEQ